MHGVYLKMHGVYLKMRGVQTEMHGVHPGDAGRACCRRGRRGQDFTRSKRTSGAPGRMLLRSAPLGV